VVVGRWVPLAAVVALLGAAMLAALFANPTIQGLPEERPAPAQTPFAGAPTDPPSFVTGPPPGLVDRGQPLPEWVSWLISALCLTGILTLVGALLWILFRDQLVQRKAKLPVERSPLPTIAETQARVRAAIDESLADLDDTDNDPRRAVIACWVRLEAAAAQAGTPPEVGDTSTELVERLLETHMVSGDVLAALAAAYREARFATHTVDEAMREQARAALRRLRDELRAGARPAMTAERGQP
jgi:hypothetical protein